jgi:Cu+-exporting ATPase
MNAGGEPATARDPVCGMKVDPATAPASEVQGAGYYFCCERCKRAFDRKPHLYIGHPPGR